MNGFQIYLDDLTLILFHIFATPILSRIRAFLPRHDASPLRATIFASPIWQRDRLWVAICFTNAEDPQVHLKIRRESNDAVPGSWVGDVSRLRKLCWENHTTGKNAAGHLERGCAAYQDNKTLSSLLWCCWSCHKLSTSSFKTRTAHNVHSYLSIPSPPLFTTSPNHIALSLA